MSNENDKNAKKEFRLVKVNSRGEKIIYDAYGHEIIEKAPEPEIEAPSQTRSGEGNVRPAQENRTQRSVKNPSPETAGRTTGGLGKTSRTPDRGETVQKQQERASGGKKTGADPDIRYAIENETHLRDKKDYQKEPDGFEYTSWKDREAARKNAANNKTSRDGSGETGSSSRTGANGSSESSENSDRAGRDKQSEKGTKSSAKKKNKSKLALAIEKSRKAREEKQRAREEKIAEREEKQREKELAEERELTAHEKRKIYKKRARRQAWMNVLKVAGVLLIIAVLVASIVVNRKNKNAIYRQYISKGYIDDSVTGELEFLRNELPVYSGYSGVFVPNVNEGDRVGANTVIGYVVRAEYTETLSELKDIESKITAAQKASSYLDSSKSSEILALEDAIDTCVGELSALAMSGNMSGYSELREELDSLLSRKNELEMNSETTDTYISGLQKQRNKILNKISSYMYEVKTPSSGVVSFYVDGSELRVSDAYSHLKQRVAETTFTSVMSSTLTPSEWSEFSVPETETATVKGREVTNGTLVARVAPDVSYYLTIRVDDMSEYSISVGSTAEVYSPSENLRFEAVVAGTFYGPDQHLVVLEANHAMAASVSLRRAEGEVIFSHTEGFKVPLRALTDWDTAGLTARITLVRSGYVEYVHVNVLGRDDVYAIINSRSVLDDSSGISVRENDEYVVNYEKVYEGQNI